MGQTGGSVEAAVESQAPTLATRNIEVHIEGSVSGQLAVGENIVQVDAKPGAIVNLYQGKPVVPRRRSTQVLLRPRPFPGLVGRAAEVAAAKIAIRAAQPFEYYAAAGWGKTTLLRYLGQLPVDAYPDGLVYQPAAGQPLEDLLQFCFDAFYETDVPLKPTPGQLRQCLQPLRAVLILDDLDLDRQHVEEMLEWLPNSAFLCAARERTLWASGQAQHVGGLEKDAAVELFEHELGRPLAADEQPAFAQLWSSLQGNPLALIQAAAEVRENQQTLAGFAGGDPATPTDERITQQLLGTVSDDERKVLGVMAAVYDAPLPASHIAAITGVGDTTTILLRWTREGLTELIPGGYRLSKEPAGALLRIADPHQWSEPIVGHFRAWAQQFTGDLRLILEIGDLLLKVIVLAADRQRWMDAWQLVRAVEMSLALSGRWSAWERVLLAGLRAAQATRDQAAEGWARHQLGTRALCLGDTAAAATYLHQALEIRERIGDSEGVAGTRHNLGRLEPPLPPPSPPPPPPKPHHLRRWLLRIGISLGAAVTAGFLLPQPGAGSLLGQTFFPSGIVSLEGTQPVDFGAVTVGRVSATRTLNVHNTGRGSLRLTAIAADPPFRATSNCPPELRPDTTCTIFLSFTPGSNGRQSGDATVTSDGNTYTAALTGSGIYTWQLSPLPIDFGKLTVGFTDRKELRLTNSSGAPLRLGAIGTKSLTKSYSVTSETCTRAAIPPDQSCSIILRFVPESAGQLADALVIADSSRNQQSYPISGQGVLPQVALSLTTVDWAKDPNTPNPQTVTLTNTGQGVLVISAAGLTTDSSPVFRVTPGTDGCSNHQVQPQGQCTIQVEHVVLGLRALANDFKGTLQFADNALDTPQSVHLHWVG